MRLLLILYIYFISLIFRTLAQRIPIAPLDNTGDSVSKYRYGELAETEFHRPGYFPVPFVVGGSVKSNGLATSQTDQVRPIPQVFLFGLNFLQKM
uniref:Secreted protein n=1 Tax=Ditylenchus dipsaci TaxID=166011 RepID=A0A915E7Z7_9BILA